MEFITSLTRVHIVSLRKHLIAECWTRLSYITGTIGIANWTCLIGSEYNQTRTRALYVLIIQLYNTPPPPPALATSVADVPSCNMQYRSYACLQTMHFINCN